jgi:antitoxin component of MazEF toxin-antitoxin module
MQFRAVVIPSGNATAVEIPDEVMEALGSEARPPVAITINGHSWRSRVAAMNGKRLVGISAANRTAAGIEPGQTIDIDLTLDTAPREVEEPDDLKSALDDRPGARAAFDKLPFGLKGKHVRDIEAAKTPEVRARRIGKLVEALGRP